MTVAIPLNIQNKFVILFDTAKKCLLILDRLYIDFEKDILRISDNITIEKDPSSIIEIYISALGLIDYFHRYQQIISAMPLIRKDQPEIRKLNKALEPVKECRNYLQHMREDLMKIDPISYPILGAISWIHNGRNYMLFSNQPTQDISSPSIIYDTWTDTYVCKYLIVVGGHEIRVDSVYTETKEFWEWLQKAVQIELTHIKEYVWGEPKIISAEFKRSQSSGTLVTKVTKDRDQEGS